MLLWSYCEDPHATSSRHPLVDLCHQKNCPPACKDHQILMVLDNVPAGRQTGPDAFWRLKAANRPMFTSPHRHRRGQIQLSLVERA